jgi:DNA excision repair protein ERCC-6
LLAPQGLGKTVQLAGFLGALHASGLYKPSLVVCPATMLRQWQRELKIWYPLFSPAILHETGVTGTSGSSRAAREALITRVAASSDGVLLTTYEQLRLFRARLLGVQWGYVVLDEGHKIRNPDAEVTILCKQFPTVHRIVMTGAPIQNRLSELWSLFDFVFPGKLGTLPVFASQFSVPITIGGYANASPLQVSTAYRCAVVLRDLVAPYLLRRMKADVALALPRKTEQVLFCPLTAPQRDAYRAFLASKDVAAILERRREALSGIDVLRKIVNHPDLLDRVRAGGDPVRAGMPRMRAPVAVHAHASPPHAVTPMHARPCPTRTSGLRQPGAVGQAAGCEPHPEAVARAGAPRAPFCADAADAGHLGRCRHGGRLHVPPHGRQHARGVTHAADR